MLDKLNNMFNKSLFTKEAYTKAIGNKSTNGYAVMRIMPKGNRFTKRQDAQIKGVITDPMSFSIEANWDSLGGIAGLVPSIFGLDDLAAGIEKIATGGNLSRAAGVAEGGTRFTTKKVYSKSGYLTITPKIKIINWYGTPEGSPVLAAMLLASYCLPSPMDQGLAGGINDVAKKLIGVAAKGISQILPKDPADATATEGNIPPLDDTTGEFANKVDQIATATMKGIGSLAKQAGEAGVEIFDGVDDYFILKSSPSPVSVSIGNYFQHDDMVITNVQFNMSKEMTEYGPLYIDAEITMSSRRIVDNIDYVGMYVSNKGNRVVLNGKNIDTASLK